MSDVARQVYIISDLHLGGVYEEPNDPSGRGFRICTQVPKIAALVSALAAKPADGPAVELVVNGDMVDFLAEREAAPPNWVPFTPDPAQAADKLGAIIDRDRVLFDAFGTLLQQGRRLTLLLGNHDIELALPRVRRRLESEIGVAPQHDFRFIHDGEAYVIGEALIEHGNRYDQFNVVDNDALRRVRSLQSRNQPIPEKYAFAPPAGSRMVAEVINPIKSSYRFIDLLKPEGGSVVPMLLALEPGYRKILGKVTTIAIASRKHRLEEAALPGFGGDISSAAAEPDPLDAVLSDAMGEDAAAFQQAVGAGDDATAGFGEDISTLDTVNRNLGMAKLLFSKNNDDIEGRLPALLKAVRALQDDKTFDRSTETYTEYLDAANDLAKGGFTYVIFGHTHLPKDVGIHGGGRYLNSGTWADLIKFPTEILIGDDTQALEGLRAFVNDIAAGRLADWIYFKPTYIRLDLDANDHILAAELCDYDGPDGV